jgi:hypothetical protein
MSLLVLLTYIGVGLLVLALALYLLTIVVILRRVRETAGLIVFGLRAIAHQAEPVGEVAAQINADLTAVRDALHGLLEKAGAMEPEGPPKQDIIEPVADQGEPQEAPMDTTPVIGTTPQADPMPEGGKEHA